MSPGGFPALTHNFCPSASYCCSSTTHLMINRDNIHLVVCHNKGRNLLLRTTLPPHAGPSYKDIFFLHTLIYSDNKKKSRIRETSNLSTDADCTSDTILESLRDLSREKKWAVDASTRPRIHASARPHDGSTRGRWTLCTLPRF